MSADETKTSTARTVVLHDDDLWTLSEHLDPAAVSSSPACGQGPRRAGSPTHVSYRDPQTGVDILLPRPAFAALRDAVLVATQARLLVGPGSLTVGMVAPAPAVWWYVGVCCRMLAGITDLVLSLNPPEAPVVPPRVADQLAVAGIGLSFAGPPGTIAFGSTLLVLAAPLNLKPEQITPGALVIEAVPNALPHAVRRQASAVLPFGAGRNQLPATGYSVVGPVPDAAGTESGLAAALFSAGIRLGLVVDVNSLD